MIFNLNNEYEKQKFKEYVNAQFCKGGIVEVKRKHHTRSTSQNAYLHLILGYYASEFGLTLDEVKFDVFKKKCNPDIFKKHRKNKRGIEVEYIRSSRDLDTLEMTTAIERFRNYSSAVAGLYIPAPNETEALFAAQQQIEKYEEYMY